MDGPGVKMTFYSKIFKHREENEQHHLIDIGNCTLHILNGTFENGVIGPEWKIRELLKGSFQVLHRYTS